MYIVRGRTDNGLRPSSQRFTLNTCRWKCYCVGDSVLKRTEDGHAQSHWLYPHDRWLLPWQKHLQDWVLDLWKTAAENIYALQRLYNAQQLCQGSKRLKSCSFLSVNVLTIPPFFFYQNWSHAAVSLSKTLNPQQLQSCCTAAHLDPLIEKSSIRKIPLIQRRSRWKWFM